MISRRLGSPGRWLEVLGVAHATVGVVLYRREIAEVVRRGVIDTVPDRGPLATAWWFLVVAPATWSAGRAMRALQDGEVPGAVLRTVGAAFAVTGAVGAVVMPRSPLGLVAAAGLAAVVTAGGR